MEPETEGDTGECFNMVATLEAGRFEVAARASAMLVPDELRAIQAQFDARAVELHRHRLADTLGRRLCQAVRAACASDAEVLVQLVENFGTVDRTFAAEVFDAHHPGDQRGWSVLPHRKLPKRHTLAHHLAGYILAILHKSRELHASEGGGKWSYLRYRYSQ
eukprot:Hpha_TRINITY_DN2862_c0_g1::TRINITY_DN2862_c0_g1_i2::g.171340::m.171340